MVPEKSGETLGVIRVGLRSKGQSMRGFGRRVSLFATVWRQPHPGTQD